jgi:aryl-alcohol dehydrogenase-like predicted oxidoreductase
MTLRPEAYLHLASDRTFRGLEAFADEARVRSVDVSALAIAWVLRHPRVDAAVIGPRTTAHLDAAVSAIAIAISDADASRLASLF